MQERFDGEKKQPLSNREVAEIFYGNGTFAARLMQGVLNWADRNRGWLLSTEPRPGAETIAEAFGAMSLMLKMAEERAPLVSAVIGEWGSNDPAGVRVLNFADNAREAARYMHWVGKIPTTD